MGCPPPHPQAWLPDNKGRSDAFLPWNLGPAWVERAWRQGGNLASPVGGWSLSCDLAFEFSCLYYSCAGRTVDTLIKVS